ncbi:uncharacterized protein LOC134777815 isoform X2 [Penaeus indicus]|uniref:uncharacterized protein LOC134777815 isoform X2 n=1 Tax=Penaeus indicus TaxID=29960 RepID=UPI00300D35BF
MAPSIQHSKMARRVLLQSLAVLLVAHAHATPSKCVLPGWWRGDWFHSGVPVPVKIDATNISFKGTCLDSDRDRYFIRDMIHRCNRCLVIHQKHENVLQYKETYCDNDKTLDEACSRLTGDAVLHSMIRVEASPVACPFPHTYTFTYNLGHADCEYPRSTVDSCTEDWRMLFRYQACPDIQGTESTIEELVCLGVWKEGSNYYLVGKSDHPLATSDEDRYRCFVYDPWRNRTASGFNVAQSGDATCNGLYSVSIGSRLLSLTRVDTSGSKCRFPLWIGGPHWHSLDGSTTLSVTRRNSTLRLNGHSSAGPVTHACLEPFAHTARSATYVTRVIHGCTNGYQCVRILARDMHVLELLMGRVTPVASAACTPYFFDPKSTNFTTFVSGNAGTIECPSTGRYKVTSGNGGDSDSKENLNVAASTSLASGETGVGGGGGGGGGGGVALTDLTMGDHNSRCAEASYKSLSFGCSNLDTLEIQTTCDREVYSCHGSWAEAGREYVVVTPTSRSSKGVRRLCLVLDHGVGVLSLASSTHSCSRDLTPGLHGHIAFNTTNDGGCHDVSPTNGSPAPVGSSPLSLAIAVMTSSLVSRGLVLLR